jgi:hypothetical protein
MIGFLLTFDIFFKHPDKKKQPFLWTFFLVCFLFPGASWPCGQDRTGCHLRSPANEIFKLKWTDTDFANNQIWLTTNHNSADFEA